MTLHFQRCHLCPECYDEGESILRAGEEHTCPNCGHSFGTVDPRPELSIERRGYVDPGV